jgi:hypothetical protein
MNYAPELYFLNCDDTGKGILVPHLLRHGVKAIIVLGEKVDNKVAADFSRAFYKSMLEGSNFGNSVQFARMIISAQYRDDVNWGVYQCYGDPGYKLITHRDKGIKKAIARDEDEDDISQQRMQAVLRITVSDQSQSTGFFMEGGALHGSLQGKLVVMTSFHALSTPDETLPNSSGFLISFRQGTGTVKLNTNEILWQSPELDIVILGFNEEMESVIMNSAAGISFYPIASTLPSLETTQKVSVVGYFGDELIPQISNKEDVLLDYMDEFIHYTRNVPFESPGCPVFDSDWQLIGIHHAWHSKMRKLHGKKGTYKANEAIWIGAIIEELQKKFDKRSIQILIDYSEDLESGKNAISRAIEYVGKTNRISTRLIWFDKKNKTADMDFENQLSDCDVFVLLFGKRFTQYLEEELMKAHQRFVSTGAPIIITYFEDHPKKQAGNRSFVKSHALDYYKGHFTSEKDLEDLFTRQLTSIIVNLPGSNQETQLVADGELENLISQYDYILRAPAGGEYDESTVFHIKNRMIENARDIIPLLSEFTVSESPGRRLAAIAALRFYPNPRYLTWLCNRLFATNEHSFAKNQAALAIDSLADDTGLKYKRRLVEAIDQFLGSVVFLYDSSDLDFELVNNLQMTKAKIEKLSAQLGGILSGLLQHAKNKTSS